MTNKQYAIIGFLAPSIFCLTYFILVSQRPEYSFLTKAISELGSTDAPNKWIWNLFGYILPGGLISLFSIGLYNEVKTKDSSKLPLIGLFLSGIFMIIAGIFPGDFNDRQSPTMILHSMGSFGSYMFFLIGTFAYPRELKKSIFWKKAIQPTLSFTWLTIVFGAWPFVFSNMPAVGQRIVFLFYFLWIVFMARRLYQGTDKK